MRITRIALAALGLVTCLSAVVPVTAEANSTSPYTRMNKVKKKAMMHNKMMQGTPADTDSAPK